LRLDEGSRIDAEVVDDSPFEQESRTRIPDVPYRRTKPLKESPAPSFGDHHLAARRSAIAGFGTERFDEAARLQRVERPIHERSLDRPDVSEVTAAGKVLG
jgi:hypothetical protein